MKPSVDWIAWAVGLGALAHHGSVRAHDSKSAAVAVASIAVIALRSPRWLRTPTIAPALAALVLLTGWLGISLTWSSHPAPAALAPWLAAAAIAFGTADDPLREKRARAATAAAIVLVGSALLWALGIAHGGHGNPNWLGLTAAAAIPLAADGAAQREGIDAEKGLYLAAVVAGLALMAVGSSRAALLGLVAATIWAAPGRWKLAAAVPLALGAFAAGDIAASARGRLVLFGDAFAAARWQGTGLGGFSQAFLEAQGARLAALGPDAAARSFVHAETAHNDLLHLLVEGGPIAAVLAIALLLLIALPLHRRWPGGSAAIVAVAVAGLGDAPMTLPAVVGLVGLVLAACPEGRAPRGSDRMAGVVVVLALAVLLPRLVVGWIAQRRLAEAQAAGAPLALLETLAETAPHDGEIALALGVALLDADRPAEALGALDRSKGALANLGTELAIGRAHLALGDAPAAILAFRRALALHPGSFRAWLGLGEAQRRAGALDDAAASLAVATDLRPHDPRLRRLAETLRRDRIDAATRP